MKLTSMDRGRMYMRYASSIERLMVLTALNVAVASIMSLLTVSPASSRCLFCKGGALSIDKPFDKGGTLSIDKPFDNRGAAGNLKKPADSFSNSNPQLIESEPFGFCPPPCLKK